MTKHDLMQLIENLDITPGHYSDAELYTIGLAYKSLSNSEKQKYHWNMLANDLGLDITGNQFRHWILNEQRKDGSLAIKGGDNKIIEETKPTAVGNFDGDHYKKVTELRDYWNAIRAEKRDEARVDSLKSIVLNAVNELKQLPQVDAWEWRKDVFKEAILLLSDLHIGVVYESNYNSYNDLIAAKRLDKLAIDTINYCEQHEIQKLNILNLGDMVQGIIHTNARMYAQYDVITQTMKAAELIAQFLHKIIKAAPEITYRSCVDNHARIMTNKNENVENENLYRIIDWYVEERLKNSNIKFIKDNIDPSLGKFDLLNGKKVCFAHGHLDSSNQIFQHFIGATREFIDYGFVGHRHSSKSKEYQNMNIIINGSIVGTEQYANSIRDYSRPSQTLLVFDNDNLIIHKIDLSIQ